MGSIFKREVRKILLIRPPLTIDSYEIKALAFPLGLAYLAAVLEKDYHVKVLDCLAEGFGNEAITGRDIRYGLSLEKLRDRIREFSPDVVGVSCLFSMQHFSSLKVCSVAKEISPEIITIMGGAHPSSLPDEVLKDNALDFILIGEAEESVLHLLQEIRSDGNFSSVDGLAYKKDGRIFVNPKTRYIDELDRIPFPAWHHFPMEDYFRINRPHGIDARYFRNTSVITSRGCPGGCLFCSTHTVFGRSYRSRSPENVLSEIALLKNKYGIKEVQFEDDNLTLDRDRARKIFEGIIKGNLDILWTTPNGIALWALDNELLGLMKKSGCWHLDLGIESGDQEVLDKIIRKPLKLEKVRPLIEQMARLNIRTNSFFVVGFPGESMRQIENTLKFATSLPTDAISIFFATPLPGTDLYRIAKEKFLLDANLDFRNLRTNRLNIYSQEISTEIIKKKIARAILLFHFKRLIKRPHAYLFKQVNRFIKQPEAAILKMNKFFREAFF